MMAPGSPAPHLLAQQGLRPTTIAGHTAVATAVPGPVRPRLPPLQHHATPTQRTRKPHTPGETATTTEAEQAITDTANLMTSAEQLLYQVTFFNQP